MKSNEIYQFNRFRLEADKPVLWHEDEIVHLKPKALETLIALIRRGGEVVTKEELMDEVWADSFVEENNLSRNVYELRRTLNEFSGEKFIETVPRRGYRFAGEVLEIKNDNDEIVIERRLFEQTLIEEVSAEESISLQKHESAENLEENRKESEKEKVLPPAVVASRVSLSIYAVSIILLITLVIGFAFWHYRISSTETASLSEIKSIAVLPLKPFPSERVDESLRLRITDGVITRLGNLKEIAVRPTNSVLVFTDANQDALEAGRKLDVDAVLDGRLQTENDRLRVTLQLISVKSGEQLWAQQFDGKIGEILALQDAIAGRLVQTFALTENKSSIQRVTQNNDAYEAYLKGRYLWNQRTPEAYWKALEFFRRSIEIDPNFALAYTGIADCYVLLNQREVISAEESLPKAEEAALKALELNPSLAEAHTSIGAVNFMFYRRWATAENHFKQAIELNPNQAAAYAWYGVLLNLWGRFDEAYLQLKKAERLDPTSLNIGIYLGTNFYFSRQFERASAQFQKVLELAPNTATAYFFLTRIYERGGLYNEAVEAELKERSISSPQTVELLRAAYQTGGIRAFWQKQIELLKAESVNRFGLDYHIASRYALLGDTKNALEYVKKNQNSRGSMWDALPVDPSFDSLRKNPEFLKLLSGMNFPH